MAAGGPASELIMFIVAIIVAGTVAGALAYVTNDIAGGMKVKGESLADQLKTDFAIINDPDNIPVTGSGPYNYTFYIKNIGKNSFAFDSNAVQVFINGSIIPSSNLTFKDTAGNLINSLDPYEAGQIIVTLGNALPSGTHKIMVVLENGKRREFIFRI